MAKKNKSATDEETAAVSTGPDKGRPESNVKRLETQWEASVMKHDTSFIDARVARDFVGVSSKGKRIDKGALLKEYKADTDTYSSARNTGVTVHTYAPNVAVANGIAKEVGKSREGAAFNRSYVWTDTWVLRGDQWQCVASHVMLGSGK
jgi:ketosteroid isomerase-like protein